jgi:SSS family solute:Na+ symporter
LNHIQIHHTLKYIKTLIGGILMSLDMMIMCGYFAASLLLGLWAGKGVKTIEDFSTGGRNYSAFFVFATLSASFIGGGFTTGLAEKVFSLGFVYVVAMWGFSIKEILVAKILAPRMGNFQGAISIGDIMHKLYGHGARVFTGVCAFLVCSAILGAQVGAFGHVLHVLADWDHTSGILLGSVIVVTYSTLGGMKSVVAADVLHFCVLIVALPLTLYFGLQHAGGVSGLIETFPTNHFELFNTVTPLVLISLFLSFFFGETLVPPYVQRLLIGKTLENTAKGIYWSGLVSIPFFLIIGAIGLVALTLNQGLDPNLALPHVIKTVMPEGLKGLAIAGMMAVVMSSADSFLNAAGIAASHDVVKALYPEITSKQELQISRFSTIFVGTIAVVFALCVTSVIDILLYSYKFWTPSILVPLIAGIMGTNASSNAFWGGSLSGIGSVIAWLLGTHFELIPVALQGSDSALIGIAVNGLVFHHIYKKERNILSFESKEMKKAA